MHRLDNNEQTGDILKRIFSQLFLLGLLMGVLSGCSMMREDTKKVKDVDFTVVEEEEVPEELKTKINEQKDDVFRLTYEDSGYLYLAVGYGSQPTGGYSVTVNELYETNNTIQMKTGLLGPSKTEEVTQNVTYPYVVVKMESIDKKTVFQ